MGWWPEEPVLASLANCNSGCFAGHAELTFLWAYPPSQRRFKITGYLPNTVYRFAAAARNAAGQGPESVPRIMFYECTSDYTDTGSGCVRKVGAAKLAFSLPGLTPSRPSQHTPMVLAGISFRCDLGRRHTTLLSATDGVSSTTVCAAVSCDLQLCNLLKHRLQLSTMLGR